MPGLLSRANPSLTVVNRAREGAGFDEVLAQLDGRERFDAVLVLAGGIDLLRGTRDAPLREPSLERHIPRAIKTKGGYTGKAPGNFLETTNSCGVLESREDPETGAP